MSINVKKYLAKFESTLAYNTFVASNDYVTPNVSLIEENGTISDIMYNSYVAPPPPHNYRQDYFTIEALESGTLSFTCAESGDGYLQYSLDGGETWSEQGGSIYELSLNANDKILFKGDIAPAEGQSDTSHVSYTEDFNVYGNMMSLAYGDNFVNQTSLAGKGFIFAYLFDNNETLLSAENLILPATTIDEYCYTCMFSGCTSLTTAPELPATTLADYCYQGMFNGCTSLNNITCLATDISATDCTYNWVDGVAASGTFTKAVSMTDWTTGIDGIPDGWTVQNA